MEPKDLHTQNYKTLMKEIKDDKQMESYIMFLDGRINTVIMTILPNAIYRFNALSIKLPMEFFTGVEQNISKFVQKLKRCQIIKKS